MATAAVVTAMARGAAGARRLANSSFVARRNGGNAKRMRAAQRRGGRSALEGQGGRYKIKP
eukprot:scaffold128282_cov57-Phaeocystis_antarctica.AAC.3